MRRTNILENIFHQLEVQTNNPYIRSVVLDNISENDTILPLLSGQEINPSTRDLIDSAEDEVLMLFYKFDVASDAGQDILQSLVSLNEKNLPGKKIRIRIMIDRRLGLAGWLTEPEHPLAWLEYVNKIPTIQLGNRKIPLNNLNIETLIHGHYFFNSYHLKEIIVDRKKLMLRSGDVWSDTNYLAGQEGRIENATIIEKTNLANFAAKNYEDRWLGIKKNSPGFYKSEIFNSSKPAVLLLEKNASSSFFKRIWYQSSLKTALLTIINNSLHSVKILTPNLNDKTIIHALVNAASRGVKIKIIMGKYHNQWTECIPGMGGTNEKNMRSLYQQTPFKFWDNLDVRWACDKQGQLLKDFCPKAMHAKLMIVDQSLVVTGSTPLDHQGLYNSAESDCLFLSRKIAYHFQSTIFKPVAKQSQAITPKRLDVVRLSLAFEIEQINLKKINFASHVDLQSLTELKQKTLTQLVYDIKTAGSFQDIDKLLVRAIQITPDNPLARHRRGNILGFFQAPYGKTATINQLECIYKMHLKGYVRKEYASATPF